MIDSYIMEITLDYHGKYSTKYVIKCLFFFSGLRFTVEPDHQVAALLQPLWWHCQAEADETVTYRSVHNYLPNIVN